VVILKGHVHDGLGVLEKNAALSPDERWLAYQSNESGQYEVYLHSFPETGGTLGDRHPVSGSIGGTEPRWGDGELFFRSGDRIMAVAVGGDGPIGELTELFVEPSMKKAGAGVASEGNYDVTRDGRRFLFIRESERATEAAAQIIVVLNFHEELKRRVRRTPGSTATSR
jgi:hypothetical protein